jgi:anti-anti-sigma factor
MDPQFLVVKETRTDSAWCFDLIGRLDGSTADAFERRLEASLAQGAHRVVLNCAQLNYLSSAGLRILLAYAKKIQRAQGRLCLAALQPAVGVVLETAGFFAFLAHQPSVDEALNRVA